MKIFNKFFNNKNTWNLIFAIGMILISSSNLLSQPLKINFPKGKIIIEAANINIIGYDGTEVIADMTHDQNRPDLYEGLTKINSLKSAIYDKEKIEYKINGEELFFEAGRMGRINLKIPNNLNVVCKSKGKNYYYYDGLKLINIDGVEGEIEVSANTSVDVDIKNCTGAMSVLTYGNIKVAMDKLPQTGLLSFDTYLGYIDLSLPENGAANLDLKAKKGDIYTNLSLRRKSNKTNVKNVKATLGGGGIDVILNAEAGGDIYLRKIE